MHLPRLLLLLTSVCTIAAQSFAPEVLWVKSLGFSTLLPLSDGTFRTIQATGPDTADLVRVNGDGTIIGRLAVRGNPRYLHPSADGYFDASGENQLMPFLIKFDLAGSPIWTNRGDHAAWRVPTIPLADGGATASGRHVSATGTTIVEFDPARYEMKRRISDGYLGPYTGGPYDGNLNFHLTRYDNAGGVRWTNGFGGSGADHFESLAVSPDEQTILLGGTSQSHPGGAKESPLLGASDAWIVSVNAAGEKVWDASLGDYGDDELRALGIVSNVIVAASGTKIVTLNMEGAIQSTLAHVPIVPQRGDDIVAISGSDFFYRGSGAIARLRLPILVINGEPTDKAVLLGSPATFHVGVQSPYEQARFQWFLNDQPLTDETNSTLSVASVQTKDLGAYSALVSTSVSTNRTRAATLALTDAGLKIRTHPSLEITGHVNRRYVIERTSHAREAINAWELADTITLTNSPQIWVDTSLELPDQRLYRARLEE